VLIHTVVICSYAAVRMNAPEKSQLFMKDPLGFTRVSDQVSYHQTLRFCQEMQVLAMLVVSLYTKWRRSNSIPEFLPMLFMHCKIGILICTWVSDYRFTGWYALAFFVMFFVLHQREDTGPSKVVSLSMGEFQTVTEDCDAVWLVEFYTTWAKNCIPFSATWNRLSIQYGSDKIKFAKVDVGRFQSLAKIYKINTSAYGNHELPTLILFEKGEPAPNQRLPVIKPDGSVNEQYVLLTEDNLKKFFKLENRKENGGYVKADETTVEKKANIVPKRVNKKKVKKAK